MEIDGDSAKHFKKEELFKAAESGDSSLFKSLAQEKLLRVVSLRNEDGRSLLHVAVSSSQLDFDVVPQDTRSVSSLGKKVMVEEPRKKKNPAAVKISPWTLARLNVEDVSKAAAEARKKSKILQPVMRNEASYAIETDSSFGSSGRIAPRPDSNRKTGGSKRIRLPAEMPLQPLSKISSEEAKRSKNLISETSTSLTILQHEARSAFRTGQAMPDLTKIVASSPGSSSDSPYIQPFQGASSASQKVRQIISLSGDLVMENHNDIPFSRSTSGGYDASGGEDSYQISTRIIHGSNNWSSLLFGSEQERVGLP